MPGSLRIIKVGLSVSAVLAASYVLVMLASLFLVGWLTTGSWQAVFLGIGWSAIAGFEIGLLGILIAGFAAAAALVPTYNTLRRRVLSPTQTPMVSLWGFKLFVACLLLPPVILIGLRGLAPVLSSGSTTLSQPMNMGPTVNTAHREAEPSFTADGRTMYFNCYSGDICISHLVGTWEQANWTLPERIEAPVSTEYEEVEPLINATGDKLYFTSNRPVGLLKNTPFLSPFMNFFRVVNSLAQAKLSRSLFNGLGLPDVYVSTWVNGTWSEPRNLNDVAGEPPINTSFADHCLFFSADGDQAFWTSTRPGGFGDNDIWTSHRVDGTWTEPENLGPNINGPGSEHTSIPTPDGQTLYVTSNSANGYGGDDIYFSTQGNDNKWSPLVNLGPLVNGPGDDRCPAWTPDLKIFLFDSVREGGFGARDIWWVDFKDVPGYPLIVKPAAVVSDGN